MTQQTDERAPVPLPISLHRLRATARTRELHDLLERRPELLGVYGPADLAVEAIRWSA